jgi:nitroreductase
MLSVWNAVVSQAIFSPSPHNVQPWKVQIVDDREAVLHLDLERTLPAEDVTGSFIISAMTIFLEAVEIAAESLGFATIYQLLNDAERLPELVRGRNGLLPFARIHLDPKSGATSSPLALALRNRVTSRLPYEMSPVDQARLAEASEEAARLGLVFGSTGDPQQIRRLLDVNVAALFHDLNDPLYHDEIAHWFRCGETDERRYRDGLSARCMNMSALQMRIARDCPSVLKAPALDRLLAGYYAKSLRCGAIAYLSGEFWEPAAALTAGRALLRVWLALTSQGLAIHPLGNLVTNKNAAAAVEHDLGVSDIFFIFKVGDSAPAPRSLRRPLEHFFVS